MLQRAALRRILLAGALTVVLSVSLLSLAARAQPADVVETLERASRLAQTAPTQAVPLLQSLGDPAALQSDALRARYFEARGIARANLQQPADARTDFAAAVKYANAAGDDRTARHAELGSVWTTEMIDGFEAAQPLYAAVLARAHAAGDLALEALGHSVRARGASVADRVDVALQSVRAAQAIGATVSLDAATRGNVAFAAAWVTQAAGDGDAARRHFEEALAAARENGDRSLEADILIAQVNLEHELGQPETALRLAERARETYAALQDELAIGVADMRASICLLTLGRTRDALARAQAAHDRLGDSAVKELVLQSLLALAAAEIDSGAHRAGHRTLARVEPLLRAEAPPVTWATYFRLRAKESAAVGDYQAALRALEESARWQERATALKLAGRNAAQRALLDYERLARDKAALEQRAATDAARLAASHERTVLLAALLAALVCLAGVLVVGFLRQRSRNRQVATLADTDALTGLDNRRSIDRAGAAMMTAKRRGDMPLAVMELDVDNFKAINDRHGHAVGDAVLQKLAAALRAQLRDGDRIGRYGGEEFLALLPGVETAEASVLAERLRMAVQTLDVGSTGSSVPLSVSIGVACAHATDQTFDQLVQRADTALYEAKTRGRNRVVVAEAPVAPTRPCAAELA